MRRVLAVSAAASAAAAAAVTYANQVELKNFKLRRVDVPVLPAGAEPVRILQVSDLHITPGQQWKVDWVSGLAALQPDFVVNTGDSLAHVEAVPEAMRALGPLFAYPGAFVGGSNDYYAPQWKNPGRYLLPDRGKRVLGPRLPWADLRDGMAAAGWTDLTHHRRAATIGALAVELAGVDDPHLKLDRYAEVAGPVSPSVDLAIGVVHSPEPRVLDAFAADGFDLVLAGHTHGGQLRVPGYGALVTNCGLEPARSRGLSQWSARTWLHVSAGLGTSPYAPVRFACPPEATLLTLVAGR